MFWTLHSSYRRDRCMEKNTWWAEEREWVWEGQQRIDEWIFGVESSERTRTRRQWLNLLLISDHNASFAYFTESYETRRSFFYRHLSDHCLPACCCNHSDRSLFASFRAGSIKETFSSFAFTWFWIIMLRWWHISLLMVLSLFNSALSLPGCVSFEVLNHLSLFCFFVFTRLFLPFDSRESSILFLSFSP